MRILILTTQDCFFLSHVKERALYLKKRGCDVGVAAQKTSDNIVKKIISLGFVFYDTQLERQSINPFSQFLALIRLLKIQQDFKPDVSYHLGAKAIFYGTFIARLINRNVGIVNAPIGLGYVFASKSLKARLLRPIVLFFYKLFLNPKRSRVIIENFEDINFFVKKKMLLPQDAFCILGAGIDTTLYKPLSIKNKSELCTVIMAARLIKEKGVFEFIEAANRLHEQGVPVRMVLAGVPDHGNPSSITEKEFEVIKQNKAVECLGFQENMIPLLQQAHICCLPSYYREGLPRILVEAASTGLAIITTDNIGCREVIRDKNGFLINPQDVRQLVNAIKYLVIHKKEREEMGIRSRKVALQYFCSTQINRRTFEVFKTLF